MPLTEAFIATRDVARKGGDDIPPPKTRAATNDRIDLKGLHLVAVSELWCVLSGKRWTVSVTERFPIVFGDDDSDGPWVHEFPSDFSERLAGLTTERIKVTAKEWVRIARLDSLDARRPGLVARSLADLVRLAKRGKVKKQSLYIWESL